MLAEASGARVVLGIGLNVNQGRGELPQDARVPASSLYATDSVRRDRAPILCRFSDGSPDHSAHVATLGPNCHRRALYSAEAVAFNGDRAADHLQGGRPRLLSRMIAQPGG